MTTKRRKVFASFHERDRKYREYFEKRMGTGLVDKSVGDGDMDPRLRVETTRARIRDEFISDASVFAVLAGKRTWRRKYVGWEIGSGLRATKKNSRCGLIGILLPAHFDFGKPKYRARLIPPRLHDNAGSNGSFAKTYRWPDPWDTNAVRNWIHAAFLRRNSILPNNARKPFGRNRSVPCRDGWSD
ncbi:MAG: TIR domain-containing protein [Albidovulum sp.]|nr:TIR domain-containing protein [Albidovulum sp.]